MRYSTQVTDLFDEAYGVLSADEGLPTLSGAAGDRAQGCRVQFFADVAEGDITRLRYLAYACPHVIAACSQVVKELEGGELSGAFGLEPTDLMRFLEIPAEKAGKILILQDALLECCRAAKAAD